MQSNLISATLSKDYFTKAFGSFTDDEIYNNILKASQRNAINLLNSDAVDQALINPLKQNLLSSVTSGADISDAIENVQQIVIGNAEKESNLLGNRKTLVRDAFAQSDREFANIVSGQYSFTYYKYQGGTVADSRCFCVERHNKFYSKQEIEAWGGKKNIGASRS